MKAKIKSFFKGGALFALLSLAAKGIGAIYRIPLTAIMGAEGIGLYQMVFPLYSVLLTISSGGLPSAISKTVSAFHSRGEHENARRTLNVSLIALSVIGAAFSLLLFLFRRPIAVVQGNPAAATAYIGIAPAVVAVAVISCFRGYFQGKLDMLPSGLSQITEQTVKLLIGLWLCSYFMRYGVEYAAFGALLGVSVSELAACLMLVFRYALELRVHKKRTVVGVQRLALESATDYTLDVAPPRGYGELLKKVLLTALPITLGSLVMPLSAVIDSILVINLLTALGESVSQATKLYGILNGPVGSLVNMPTVITGVLSVMLLPKVSAVAGDREKVAAMAEKYIRLSFLIALPCALGLSLFSGEILSLLYRKTMSAQLLGIGSTLLSVSSLTVLYMSILQPVTAVLQGCGNAYKPALNLLIGACLKAVSTIIFLRVFGIVGACMATVACFSLTCLLDVIALRKLVKVEMKIGKVALVGALSGAALIVVGKLCLMLLSAFLPHAVALVAALVLAGGAYVALTLLLRGVSREELRSLLG